MADVPTNSRLVRQILEKIQNRTRITRESNGFSITFPSGRNVLVEGRPSVVVSQSTITDF